MPQFQYTRQNVWKNGGDFNDPVILAYAQGVAGMQARGLDSATSWRFYAAIHGEDFTEVRGVKPPTDFWQNYGYYSDGEPIPPQSTMDVFWDQCQHGSWYFLPWHRGYLLGLEANVRAVLAGLDNPAVPPGEWALPYWDYLKQGQNGLPPAFTSQSWPGQGQNPLYVSARFGADPLDPNRLNLQAMGVDFFTGSGGGGDPGFGGIDTGFSWSGGTHGRIETQPHDMLHVLVGGTNQGIPGLMSFPPTAGLDPIFYLHHANIDRLWQVWRQNPVSNTDPQDPSWTQGPVPPGGFNMPMPNGNTWNYYPGQLADDSTLDYTYDDLTPEWQPPQQRLARRLQLFGVSPESVAAQGARPVPRGKNIELLGASPQPLKISGTGEVRTAVNLDTGVQRKVVQSFAAVAQTAKEPDRVFLNLENVTGLADATAFDVYVGVPGGAGVTEHPDLKAGSVALFGVTQASQPEHGGEGLTFVLDITDAVDQLHLSNSFDLNTLEVRIVPLNDIDEHAKIQIGRISIYRQGD